MNEFKALIAAAAMVLAVSAPTLAAQRAYRGYDAFASSADRSGAYYYGPQGVPAYDARAAAQQALTPSQSQYNRAPYGQQSLPYPDRPYGAPDSW